MVVIVVVVAVVLVLTSRISEDPPFSPGDFYQPGPPLSAEEVLAECRKAGLSTLADKLEEAVLPCLRMVPSVSGGSPSPPITQIGGKPNLPDPALWPKHQGKSLSFIAQVNLSEVPLDAQSRDLPRKGILYFFYDSEQSTWGFDPKDKGTWRVLYLEDLPDKPSPVDFPDDVPKHAQYVQKRLKIIAGKSIPEPLDHMQSLGLSDERQDQGLEFYGRYSEGGSPKHQLLGHPMPIQGDMQLECQLVSNGLYCGDPSGYNDPRAKELESGASQWRLLLQVDTDEDSEMMWGDCGRLYFWIRDEDLRKRNFGAVWMILQCT
jgi:uncharacterized protein YwqG